MYVADMHCDTISEIYHRRKNGESIELAKSSLQIDLEKLQQGNYILQNFAIFVNQGLGENPYQCAKNQIAVFQEEMRQNADKICQVTSIKQVEENRATGRISALLTMEEGEACEGDLEKLEEFYDAGVRMMTFTWNYKNSLGSPATELPLGVECGGLRCIEWQMRKETGLTEQGIAFLEKMEQLGIIPDVSHLSAEGFYDVCRYSKKPFVASHSDAAALCGHKRNLTDDMIREIAKRGGVIGINYYGRFLEERGEHGIYYSRVSRIADHILHMIRVGGIACVGLGADFDGMDDNLEMEDCSKMVLLWEELRKRGLSEEEVEAVFYRNVWELYRECLQ